jgi:hypothetical protein
MSVRILLTHHYAYRDLSKDFILQEMPETILGQALQGDPEAKEIEIPSPDVTPKALAVIVLLSEGKTPLRSEPECYQAGRYLNYPLLAAFGDLLYNRIDRVSINCERNQTLLKQSPRIENFLSYLIWRQLDFSFVDNNVLCLWISTASKSGSKLLLSQPTLKLLASGSKLLFGAAGLSEGIVLERLLEDPRVQTHLDRRDVMTIGFIDKYPDLSVKIALLPETKTNQMSDWQYQHLISLLVEATDYEALEQLLQKPQAKPTGQHVYEAVRNGYVKTLTALLTRKDIALNPPGPDEIMIIAALAGEIDCVRVLLADGRFSMRSLKGNAILQRYPELQELYNLTM